LFHTRNNDLQVVIIGGVRGRENINAASLGKTPGVTYGNDRDSGRRFFSMTVNGLLDKGFRANSMISLDHRPSFPCPSKNFLTRVENYYTFHWQCKCPYMEHNNDKRSMQAA
jgi:hypothetical protein